MAEDGAELALPATWVFWAMVRRLGTTRAVQTANYEGGLRQISAPISTAEDLWAVYCRLARAGSTRRDPAAPGAPFVLPLNSDIQFFRAGIKPVWEDPANTNGGRWTLRVRKALTARLWEQLLLSLAAGMLDNHGVCGAVLSIRWNDDVIAVWCVDPETPDAPGAPPGDGRTTVRNLRLRDKLRAVLGLPHHVFLEYKAHEASAARGDRQPRPTGPAASLLASM